jgi:hypothetical protein
VETTTEIIETMELVVSFARRHELSLEGVRVSPGSPGSRYLRGDLPVIASAELFLFGQPLEFLRWCEALGVESVEVHRRDLDVCLHAFAHDVEGITWKPGSSVSRLVHDGKNTRVVKALPGITVNWNRTPSGRRGDHARVGLADLRVSLSLLESDGVALR